MTHHQHPAAASATPEQAAALVQAASGADTAAIDGLEAIAADLRRARTARLELAATEPTEMLRQVLLERSRGRA